MGENMKRQVKQRSFKRLKPLRPENYIPITANKIQNNKRNKKRGRRGKIVPSKKSFLWVPCLILILIFSIFSLKERKDLSMQDFKLNESISITGEIRLKDKSGKVTINFGDGSKFTGGLSEGRFADDGVLLFPEADKAKGKFKEGELKDGAIVLKDGNIWTKDDKGNWNGDILKSINE